MEETVDTLIATLNQMDLGDLDAIRSRLKNVRGELQQRRFEELVAKLDECALALERGDLETFRRIKATIVSRLGHLRSVKSNSGSTRLGDSAKDA